MVNWKGTCIDDKNIKWWQRRICGLCFVVALIFALFSISFFASCALCVYEHDYFGMVVMGCFGFWTSVLLFTTCDPMLGGCSLCKYKNYDALLAKQKRQRTEEAKRIKPNTCDSCLLSIVVIEACGAMMLLFANIWPSSGTADTVGMTIFCAQFFVAAFYLVYARKNCELCHPKPVVAVIAEELNKARVYIADRYDTFLCYGLSAERIVRETGVTLPAATSALKEQEKKEFPFSPVGKMPNGETVVYREYGVGPLPKKPTG